MSWQKVEVLTAKQNAPKGGCPLYRSPAKPVTRKVKGASTSSGGFPFHGAFLQFWVSRDTRAMGSKQWVPCASDQNPVSFFPLNRVARTLNRT